MNPKDLNTWSPGQLKMQVASMLNAPLYLMLDDDQKRRLDYPVSIDEMKVYLREQCGMT